MDGETWLEIDAEVKGNIYEELKRLEEVKTSSNRALQNFSKNKKLKC